MSAVAKASAKVGSGNYDNRSFAVQVSGSADKTSPVPYFLLAFKVSIEEDDHWLNKLAVWGTSSSASNSKKDDTEGSQYRGKISHVEILINHEDEKWYRYSIMKKTGQRRKDGSILWQWGKVHAIATKPDSVKNYRFYRINSSFVGVNKALSFLEEQVNNGSQFNFSGYVLNFIFPFKIGNNNYLQAVKKKRNNWFCTELVICALQAGGVWHIQMRKACAVSPNELYRLVTEEHLGDHVYSHIAL